MTLDEKRLIDEKQLRFFVVRIEEPAESPEEAEENLAELCFLVESAGYAIGATQAYGWRRPDPATYLTKGRVEEVKSRLHQGRYDAVLVDAPVSPVQVRNLEKAWEKPVLDREGLILQIFARNARTAQAKAQVELAQLEYELPRLTHRWTHLSRERGGIGLRGGGGEQQIEIDRRKIRQRLSRLRRLLAEYQKQAAIRRERREMLLRISLVGYTNVGKSTLMRLLSKAPVLVENRLFATLDTTSRKIVLDGLPILLSDTVGFIRKLPPNLLEAFHTTLEEVREADLLLLVVDAGSPNYLQQIRIVERTLEKIGAGNIPILLVMNKIDRLSPDALDLLEKSWQAQTRYPTVFISAAQKIGLDTFYQILTALLREIQRRRQPTLPPSRPDRLDNLLP